MLEDPTRYATGHATGLARAAATATSGHITAAGTATMAVPAGIL